MEGRPLDDGLLVERARSGDVDAYQRLMEIHQGLAHRVAYLVTRSGAEAEDAVQEAFVKAYYALDRFRPGAPFKPWLLRIVANEARNRMRSQVRREGLALRASEARPSGEAAPSPEEAVLASEGKRKLLEAVGSLKEPDRIVISLRFFAELTEAEMAEVLDIPRGTVKSRLSRALDRLRAVLPTDGREGSEE